jgi:hypothetical protein
MADIIQIRRDTAANWTSAKPTLTQGEIGFETDTLKMKIGTGSTAWTSLAYYTPGVYQGVRVTSITTNANPTFNVDNCDAVDITAQAGDIASMTTNMTGTGTNFQRLLVRFKDDGTARAITWGANFVAGGVALPTTTVISKILTVGFIYNTANSLNKWQCVASVQEA